MGNVWIKGDDVVDALMLSGTPASDQSVDVAIQQLRNFLPGIISGKFCLQELLAINEFHENLPVVQSLSEKSTTAINTNTTTVRKSDNTVSTRSPSTAANPLASSAEFKASDTRQSQQLPRSSWRLPFRGKTAPISKAAIKEEFRRLDILGEGRLTMLNLRSALELREVRESSDTVRDWFRENDHGGKGYISYSDYESIYNDSSSTAHRGGLKTATFSDTLLNTKEGKTLTFAPTTTGGTTASSGRNSPSTKRRSAAEERLQLLKKAFDRYDVDRDGRISSEDLRQAFTAQGKAFTPADLQTWVSTRDLSGTGAVNFDDFVKHYK